MASDQASFEDLLVDEQELNEEMVAKTLSEFIRIGQDSGGLYPQAAFENLNSYRKTAVVLLAQHAREALGLAETEWLTPSEIADAAAMKKGTIYPAVRKLEEMAIAENDDGSYRIPAPNLSDAQHYIKEAEDE